jgi:protein phosphatase
MIEINKDVVSLSDVGLERQANEDSCGTGATPNGFLCVVCDGMGGHVGGAQASRIATDCITQYLTQSAYPDIRKALSDALYFANLQIIGTAAEHPELKGMGTTACVLLVQDEQVWLAHAGDSRIYLYVSKTKQLHRLTKDHSYVQGLIDQGLITDAEAETNPNKNRILKALGIKAELNPEVCENPVLPAKGDIFLICSDGLSGMVNDANIQGVLARTKNLQQAAAELLEMAKAAGGTDNITLQLVRTGNSPHRKSVFVSKNPVRKTSDKKPVPAWIKYACGAAIVAAILLTGVWLGRVTVTKPPVEAPETEAEADTVKTNAETACKAIEPEGSAIKTDTAKNKQSNPPTK